MLLLTAILVLLFLYAVLIFFYWHGWLKLQEEKITNGTFSTFISVIVAARNEEKNISTLLKALSEQTYPKEFFEIIIVNDFSTDNTEQAVSHFFLNNLQLIRPPFSEETSSKKKAIESGVQKAKGKLLVITDADCVHGKNWLLAIHNYYLKNDAVFIAAPVKFSHNKSFLQIFQALDFLALQGITAASVSLNFHTMCNGANLAYTKQAFEEVNGFTGIDRVATGDDMLLMHKIWKRNMGKVLYLKSREAVVSTQPMLGWKSFFAQRKRWASKTFVFNDFRILAVLIFVYLFNLGFLLLIIASFFNSFYWQYVIGFWILKTLVEFPFIYSVAQFYEEQKLMRYFFFFQPLHIFSIVITGVLSQLGKYEWKGRKTK